MVLESCGGFGLVRYVSDFMLWFKIASSLCEADCQYIVTLTVTIMYTEHSWGGGTLIKVAG